MREQIQAYVNGLFADAALTIRNAEVRQEILQHTLDRYDDLVASGKPEQEAYDEAVAGIGDVSELYEHKPAEKQAEAPKSARDFPAPPAAVCGSGRTCKKEEIPWLGHRADLRGGGAAGSSGAELRGHGGLHGPAHRRALYL